MHAHFLAPGSFQSFLYETAMMSFLLQQFYTLYHQKNVFTRTYDGLTQKFRHIFTKIA